MNVFLNVCTGVVVTVFALTFLGFLIVMISLIWQSAWWLGAVVALFIAAIFGMLVALILDA